MFAANNRRKIVYEKKHFFTLVFLILTVFYWAQNAELNATTTSQTLVEKS